jgi:hypothetical protein
LFAFLPRPSTTDVAFCFDGRRPQPHIRVASFLRCANTIGTASATVDLFEFIVFFDVIV